MEAATELRVRYEPLPHQWEALQSKEKITFLGGGVGCGKTDVGTIWLIRRLSESPPGVLHAVCANTYPQLYDSTLRNVFKNFDRFGVAHKPETLPRSHSPLNLGVFVNGNWHEVLCRSLDHYEALSGVELGDAWLDEVWQTKREAIDLVLARLRDTRVRNQMLLTTTLDDPATWMYEMFVENYQEELHRVIYARTTDNPHLPADYVDHLRRTYSDRLFQRMVLSKWVSLESGQVYHAFDRNLHVDPTVEYDPALPILWTHDFNIGEGKPMSSCLCQIKKGRFDDGTVDGRVRPELHIFDELILDSTDTNDSVQEFFGREWAQDCAGVKVYGDASGKARDTRSKTTDYKILTDALTEGRLLAGIDVPKANPPLRDSHNAVNALLRSADGDVRVKLHPRCRVLAKGLETVRLKGGANYLEEETREQHVTTALRYLIAREFPLVRKEFTSRKFRLV